MKSIVVILGSYLSPPDFKIIVQDDELNERNSAMYFVGFGKCYVKVRDHNGQEQVVSNLSEGDHFGEVAMIYKCRRTATVVSCGYNTFARIMGGRLNLVISEFPEYKTCLIANLIREYRDKKIEFVLRMIKRVEYLAKHDDEVLFDLMFSMKYAEFEIGTYIFEEGKPADRLTFIEDGSI